MGVQPVAFCSELSGSEVEAPLVAEVPEGPALFDLLPPSVKTSTTTSASTPSTATPAMISHGAFEPGPFGGGPGEYGPVGQPGPVPYG
ncbi:hypothetical protein MPS_5090 [Mycobacterium pseudoshottsii JCM 15466]|nr:hypothetical protein MPS_5090 [Mycobacterium pseudoshottsii JCM 15466]